MTDSPEQKRAFRWLVVAAIVALVTGFSRGDCHQGCNSVAGQLDNSRNDIAKVVSVK